MKPEYFRESESVFARGAQAYLILIGDAAAGRLPTYEELGEKMKHPPMLGDTLDRLAAWTKEHDLPDIASIVVGKDTGRPNSFDNPGPHHPYGTTLQQWPSVLSAVRKVDWFAVVPPTAAEIAQAWARFVAERDEHAAA